MHMSIGGPDRFIVDARGKKWTFEDHPRLGPVVLKRAGGAEAVQPGEGSAFWLAEAMWRQQGKRIGGHVLTK